MALWASLVCHHSRHHFSSGRNVVCSLSALLRILYGAQAAMAQQQKSALQLFLEATQAAGDTESQMTLQLSAHALSVILDPIDSCLPSSAGAAAPEPTTLTAEAATGRTPTLEAPTTTAAYAIDQ